MNENHYKIFLSLVVFILLLSGLWVTSWYLSFKLMATGVLTLGFGAIVGEVYFKE